LDNKVIVWLVTKDHKDYSQTEVSREELNGKIRSYLKAIRANDSDTANQIGKELYAKLIAPIETKLNAALELCIVPDDKLNFLPFGMLVSPSTGRYLLEDF